MNEAYHSTNQANTANMKRYALRYARRGVKVFPCRVSDKAPLTGKGGHHNATTDPEQIERWWTKHPEAAIGAPTAANGWVVMDLDEDTHEAQKLWYRLPETLTAKTGRASGIGRHAYYSVDEPVASRKLAGGAIDLKGNGYVILPPSLHASGNCYEWLHKAPVAPLPEELLTGPQFDEERPSSGSRNRQRRYTDNGGPILKGERDDALASIGGLLRAQGLEQGEILDELHAVNKTRCEPPLKPSQVRKIAKSVSRYPKGKMARRDERTRAPLEEARASWWRSAWPNKSDRDIVHVLINEARQHGRLLPGGGVDVSLSYRVLAVKAAVSLRTVRKSVKRLTGDWLRPGSKGAGTQSGSFVLLPRAGVPHSDHHGVSSIEDSASVVHPRTPRLRHSATLPVMRKGRRIDTLTILRLGKTNGAIIDVLEAHGPSVDVEDIAAVLHVKRVRDMKRRNISRLEERGIVRVEGDTVTLVADWVEALETERSITGEKFAEAYWTKRYREQRDAYRGRHKVKAHRFGFVDMWSRILRPLSEVEKVPEPHPDLVEALGSYLWQHPQRDPRRDGGESYSWLAVALWSGEHVGWKPTAEGVEVAHYVLVHSEAGKRAS